MPSSAVHVLRFGTFELDTASGELRNAGRTVKVPPQPFKLLVLMTANPGRLITRDEIRNALWDANTFIDFDQAVNFTVRQVREALNDDGDRAVYVQTVPKRGYRFIAPVDSGEPPAIHTAATDGTLTKLLWTNVAELRLEEQRRLRNRRLIAVVTAVAGALIVVGLLVWAVWLRAPR